MIAATSIRVIDMLEGSTERRDLLMDNATHFRARMGAAGFDLLPGEHPIIPVMLRDPKLAQDMAARLDAKVFCGAVLVPRRSAWAGPHPHSDVRGP